MGKGRLLPSLPKDQFPALLKKLTNELSTKGVNMVAGFKKSDFLTDCLRRKSWNSISESFMEHLQNLRGDDQEPQRKKKKLDVSAEKGITPGMVVEDDQ